MFLILIKTLIKFFNSRANLIYVLPDNRLLTEILTYSVFKISIIQPDPSLIQLLILCKTSSKDLLRPYLILITVLVVELK